MELSTCAVESPASRAPASEGSARTKTVATKESAPILIDLSISRSRNGDHSPSLAGVDGVVFTDFECAGQPRERFAPSG